MRPIDGDALEAACEQLADKLRHDGQKTDAQLLEALAAVVKFCPTLDVEPIRHGHWTMVDVEGYFIPDIYKKTVLQFPKCSVCGTQTGRWALGRFRRCHECGAFMDEAPAVDNPAVDNPADGRPAVDSPSVDKGADANGT